jgi:hypothetical protein
MDLPSQLSVPANDTVSCPFFEQPPRQGAAKDCAGICRQVVAGGGVEQDLAGWGKSSSPSQ